MAVSALIGAMVRKKPASTSLKAYHAKRDFTKSPEPLSPRQCPSATIGRFDCNVSIVVLRIG